MKIIRITYIHKIEHTSILEMNITILKYLLILLQIIKSFNQAFFFDFCKENLCCVVYNLNPTEEGESGQ